MCEWFASPRKHLELSLRLWIFLRIVYIQWTLKVTEAFDASPTANWDTNAAEPGKDDLGEKQIMWCNICNHLGPLFVFVCETVRHLWEHTECLSHNLDLFHVVLVVRLFVLLTVTLHPLVNISMCSHTHTPISCLNCHTYASQHVGSRCLRGHVIKVWVSVSLFLIFMWFPLFPPTTSIALSAT